MTAKLSKRAATVLAMMQEPDRILDGCTGRAFQDFPDQEWFRLNLIPNVWTKTINELLAAGVIEPRGTGIWGLFRLVADEWNQDFGDLWVAA